MSGTHAQWQIDCINHINGFEFFTPEKEENIPPVEDSAPQVDEGAPENVWEQQPIVVDVEQPRRKNVVRNLQPLQQQQQHQSVVEQQSQPPQQYRQSPPSQQQPHQQQPHQQPRPSQQQQPQQYQMAGPPAHRKNVVRNIQPGQQQYQSVTGQQSQQHRQPQQQRKPQQQRQPHQQPQQQPPQQQQQHSRPPPQHDVAGPSAYQPNHRTRPDIVSYDRIQGVEQQKPQSASKKQDESDDDIIFLGETPGVDREDIIVSQLVQKIMTGAPASQQAPELAHQGPSKPAEVVRAPPLRAPPVVQHQRPSHPAQVGVRHHGASGPVRHPPRRNHNRYNRPHHRLPRYREPTVLEHCMAQLRRPHRQIFEGPQDMMLRPRERHPAISDLLQQPVQAEPRHRRIAVRREDMEQYLREKEQERARDQPPHLEREVPPMGPQHGQVQCVEPVHQGAQVAHQADAPLHQHHLAQEDHMMVPQHEQYPMGPDQGVEPVYQGVPPLYPPQGDAQNHIHQGLPPTTDYLDIPQQSNQYQQYYYNQDQPTYPYQGVYQGQQGYQQADQPDQLHQGVYDWQQVDQPDQPDQLLLSPARSDQEADNDDDDWREVWANM